jgi:hypothetical protein
MESESADRDNDMTHLRYDPGANVPPPVTPPRSAPDILKGLLTLLLWPYYLGLMFTRRRSGTIPQ